MNATEEATDRITFVAVAGPEAQDIDPDHLAGPANAVVSFAFRNGKVIGRSAIIQLPHIEGTWIADEERGSTLGARLIREIEKGLKNSGKTHAFAFADSFNDEVKGYLERFGYKRQTLDVYMKEL